jgi:hypothetical protein
MHKLPGTDKDAALLRALAEFYNGTDQPVGFDSTIICGDILSLRNTSFLATMEAAGIKVVVRHGWFSTRTLQALRRWLKHMHNRPTGGFALRHDEPIGEFDKWWFVERSAE